MAGQSAATAKLAEPACTARSPAASAADTAAASSPSGAAAAATASDCSAADPTAAWRGPGSLEGDPAASGPAVCWPVLVCRRCTWLLDAASAAPAALGLWAEPGTGPFGLAVETVWNTHLVKQQQAVKASGQQSTASGQQSTGSTL